MSIADPGAFGRALARIRRARGDSQQEVADRIPYYSDAGAYGRVERGERHPEREVAIAILAQGLLVRDVQLINQTIELEDYSPLTAAEMTSLGLAPVVTPVEPPTIKPFTVPVREEWRDWQVIAVVIVSVAAVGLLGSLIRESVLFAVSTSLMYGALYVVSLALETAFGPPFPARIAARTFAFVAVTSISALLVDRFLVRASNHLALAVSFGVFVATAIGQFAIVRKRLPEAIIVPASFAQTAQGAHLKNTGYFLLIVVLYWLPSFHCISTLAREARFGHAAWAHDMAGRDLIVGRGVLALSPRCQLALVLIMFLVAMYMGSRLMDNLRAHDRLNAFTKLFYLRALLYFVLCLVSIVWYGFSLSEFQ